MFSTDNAGTVYLLDEVGEAVVVAVPGTTVGIGGGVGDLDGGSGADGSDSTEALGKCSNLDTNPIWILIFGTGGMVHF